MDAFRAVLRGVCSEGKVDSLRLYALSFATRWLMCGIEKEGPNPSFGFS
jgi:hypothetical protein